METWSLSKCCQTLKKQTMKKLTFAITALILLCGNLFAQDTESKEINNYKFSDCHFHLLDFLQNGEFLNTDHKFPGTEWGLTESGRYTALPFGERGRRIEAMLKGMKLANVGHIMVCGMPFVKKWSENEPFRRPKYYLESSSRMKRARDSDITVASAIVDYKQKYANDPGKLAELKKIHPFICGFDGTDLGAVDLIVKRVKEFPGIWHGIGEVMSRHDDLTNLTSGERPRANHPSLLRVSRFAGEKFLPVSIHHNIAPISRNPKEIKEPFYLDEFIDLVRYSKWQKGGIEYKTTFIWCHAGISRRVTINNLPYWMEEVLKEFGDQVFIDISWVVLEDYINKDMESWIQLIKKYPNKFMIGSDAVGGASKIKNELSRYEKLLSLLPEDVRTKVAYDNFATLMNEMADKRAKAGLGKDGLVLEYNYEFPRYEHTGRLLDSDSFTRSRSPSGK